MRYQESNTQVACVRWFRLQYPNYHRLLFAVPNGGARDAREGSRLKAEGVTAGVADLLLLIPTTEYHGLCIEMKRKADKERGIRAGTMTTDQRCFKRVVEWQGYKHIVCHDLDEFKKEIETYLQAL